MPDTSRSVAANANHVTVAGDDAGPSMMPTPNSRDIPTESTMTTREPRSDSHSTPPKAITPRITHAMASVRSGASTSMTSNAGDRQMRGADTQ